MQGFLYRYDTTGGTIAVTARRRPGLDGHSVGPFDGLNLGGHVGDDPAAVVDNRKDLAAAVGVAPDRLLFMNQCHSSRVQRVDGPWEGAVPEVDALVTTVSRLALAVLVADCVPVMMIDECAGVAAVAHAGRVGMMTGVVRHTLSAMKDAGSLGGQSICAVVGPSVCSRCYEVPAQMRDEAAAIEPVSAAMSWHGTPAIDVASAVVAQLASQGVRVNWLAGCTREDEDLYSHRRDPQTGRFAGVVVLS